MGLNYNQRSGRFFGEKEKTMTIAQELQNLDTSGQIMPVVSLPDVPTDMYGNGKEFMQAVAWEVIWDWCNKYGLAVHSYEHREQYDKLNGPQMIAQWIIDMKSALFFCEQCIGRNEGNDETT